MCIRAFYTKNNDVIMFRKCIFNVSKKYFYIHAYTFVLYRIGCARY